ncbi:MAG: UDP-3-O-acyl-N-acetylglucosamine deacetylase [Pseudomonadales bacterium]|nr:UDP-3-O-acyl-N-acetylglucosamine deacetylase [Pseudomonadales bacterium]
MLRQRTIRKAVHAIGIGVHSGEKVRVSFRPAEVNTGIRFYRSDLGAVTPIIADATQVSDTTLSTTIGRGQNQVSTVEHLMSALWGLGIDNMQVHLQGSEIPILDGSAAPFVYLIQSAGIEEQSEIRQFMRITKTVEVRQGEAWARLSPFNGFKAAYTFVADHPVYNRYPKRASVNFATSSFVEEVSRARSFGLLSELGSAQSMQKCLGSSLHNSVGIDGFNILNEEGLRYEDEFVKHKLLDAIGDLYLLGNTVIGEFDGYMSGHGLNNELALELLRRQDAWEFVGSHVDDSTLWTQDIRPLVGVATA